VADNPESVEDLLAKLRLSMRGDQSGGLSTSSTNMILAIREYMRLLTWVAEAQRRETIELGHRLEVRLDRLENQFEELVRTVAALVKSKSDAEEDRVRAPAPQQAT
jgi:hypothetical protein